MSNPLEEKTYTFYLNFINSVGRFEITEPVKFDGATFVLEQDDMRYGRDVAFMNESIDLFFYNGVYDVAENPLMLPNGTIVNHLTQGFDYLLEAYKNEGFEAEIQFILENDGVEFVVGVLDFQNAETDQFNYLSCKVIQNTNKQIIKRRSDYVVDVFSDEDVDGNPITPLSTTNILLKAKPVVQESELLAREYAYNSQFFGAQTIAIFPIFNDLIKFGIQDTFVPLDQVYQSPITQPFLENTREDSKILLAQEDLTDITVNISQLSLICTWDGILDITKRLYVLWGDSYVTGEFNIEYLEETDDRTLNISNQDYTVNIPFIPRGGFLGILFTVFDPFTTPSSTPTSSGGINIYNGSVSITATSTAIDTVIKGVRWVDLIKQNVKSISGLDTYAPRLDVGGEHYDNFAFTGNLIKRRDDVAFPVKFKDLMNTIQEHNGDYQILNDKVYVNAYPDFYPNNEIGAFLTTPDDTAKSLFNPRYAINQFEFGYKTFEQDKDEGNTIDAVHTQTQWSIDNRQVENNKKVELDQIRDAFKIEFARQLASRETTSTDDDDKLFLMRVIELAPSTRGGFVASFTHNISNGQLRLLKDADLPSWGVLGFNVGADFNILSGQNQGSYTVAEIEDTIITLDGSGFLYQGVSLNEVDYPLQNVQYTNMTNEGFTVINNVLNPDKYSNLLYTPKRNILHWESYIKTASKYKPNGSFRNRYFRNNGELETQYTGETEITIEKADILNDDLETAILTPMLYETRLVVPYSDAVDMLNKVDVINSDDTIGGFIRCVNNNNRVLKLYPKKIEYEPATETMTLTGEERDEGIGVSITTSDGIIYINEVGYDINTGYDWYEFNNEYLQIFDNDNLPIINPTRYDNVTINGETFDNEILLSEKLIEIS